MFIFVLTKIYVRFCKKKCDLYHIWYLFLLSLTTEKPMIMQKCSDCTTKCGAASSLSSEQMEVMENNSVEVHFKKGDNIFRQGALSLNIAFLKSGIAKIHMHGPAREKILRIVRAPSYLGLPTSLGDKINQFSATALAKTSVCFIDIALFKNLIYNNGKFAYEIIVELCQNELNDYQRYTSQSQKQMTGMIAETLLCMSEKIFKDTKFIFPLTQSELGDMVGTSRESVSRVLSEFSSDKIIEISGKGINILNKDLLKQISEKG